MVRAFDVHLDGIDGRSLVRPAAIWLGLATFFFGSILFGETLATSATAFEGPLFMLLGVALVGGGFTMEPSEFEYDPEIAFSGRRYYVVAGVSALFVAVTAGLLLLTVL